MLPHGPTHAKVEALVLAVRTIKMCLKNVNAESQLFANCPTVGNVVSKLDQKHTRQMRNRRKYTHS